MPILSAEPDSFPNDLFQSNAHGEKRWWVMHTRPRQEKSLARQLYNNESSFFLPLLRKRSLTHGRAMESHLPLFGGYLFLLGDHRDLQFALGTRRIARPLEVRDQQRLWSDLRQIQQLIALGLPLRPEDQLTPGTAVEIQHGPLAGFRGVIVRSSSGNRFVVKVDFIQRGASVLLDESAIASV
jgi:transcription antitermination factor NusG